MKSATPALVFLVSIYCCRAVMAIDEDHNDKNIGDSIISKDELLEALKIGKRYAEDLDGPPEGFLTTRKYPYKGSLHYSRHSSNSLAQSKEAAVELTARKHLSEKFNVPADQISFDQVADHQSHYRVERAAIDCSGVYSSPVGFRTFDGTCNNLENKAYGSANTINQRFLPADYSDGVGVPRSGPSARAISNAVLQNESLPNYINTLLVMQVGQFVDHDLVFTPTFADTTNILCCDGTNTIYGNAISPAPSPECFPISLPSNDIYFAPFNCMNFVRSEYGNNLDGSTPPSRIPINSNTHWIDASQVYGSSPEFAAALRNSSAGQGLLAISMGARNLLPIDTSCCPGDPTNSCSAAPYCFVGGDSRVSEQPFLTVMHAIFVREHNRIANSLYKLNPGLSDETYFQYARQILIAEWQNIVYTEWLPVLIGEELASQVYKGNWKPNHKHQHDRKNDHKHGHKDDHKQDHKNEHKHHKPIQPVDPPNPAVFVEFSTAAFRVGHTMIKSYFRVIDKDTGVNSSLSFFIGDAMGSRPKVFSSNRLLDPNFFDGALRGMILTPVQKSDNCFAEDLTHQLFRQPGGNNLGFDLVSRNIQRGRDHGIPPYYRYWKNPNFSLVNPNRPTDFSSLAATHTEEIISYLKKAYASVNDIDLFIGGVTEIPQGGAIIGPTFANMFAKQFDRLKQGDRFFYDNNVSSGNRVPQFTAEQLAEIKKVTFSSIICNNNDGTIATVQPKSFFAADLPGNSPVACSSIPRVNLGLWKNLKNIPSS